MNPYNNVTWLQTKRLILVERFIKSNSLESVKLDKNYLLLLEYISFLFRAIFFKFITHHWRRYESETVAKGVKAAPVAGHEHSGFFVLLLRLPLLWFLRPVCTSRFPLWSQPKRTVIGYSMPRPVNTFRSDFLSTHCTVTLQLLGPLMIDGDVGKHTTMRKPGCF